MSKDFLGVKLLFSVWIVMLIIHWSFLHSVLANTTQLYNMMCIDTVKSTNIAGLQCLNTLKNVFLAFSVSTSFEMYDYFMNRAKKILKNNLDSRSINFQV